MIIDEQVDEEVDGNIGKVGNPAILDKNGRVKDEVPAKEVLTEVDLDIVVLQAKMPTVPPGLDEVKR
eukprot:1141923-Amphidinium_carterae.1